jgi:hypothetical protein
VVVFAADGTPIPQAAPAPVPAPAPAPVAAAAPAPASAPVPVAAAPAPAPEALPVLAAQAPPMPAAVVTREALPYLVDGAEASLIRDAWAMRDGDPDAATRLRRFQAQVADGALVDARALALSAGLTPAQVVQAAADTSAGAGVTPLWAPPGYRPDLYVDELTFPTPLVDACASAPIADATPFQVPRFVSGPGVADVAAEGVNPATGNIVSELVTVTPKPVSGIYDASRELVDSSAAGVAVDRIALAAMREDYSQKLEARVAAALIAAGDGTDVPVGASPSPAAYYQALRRAIVDHATRRGLAPTNAFSPGAVFSVLAETDRADGSPLLPFAAFGTVNTAGVQGRVLGANVMGVPYDLAWRLDALHSVLVSRPDAWVFTSPVLQFRMEEVVGPAQIRLALWGYQAAKVLRPAGVTRLTHTGSVDPAVAATRSAKLRSGPRDRA